MANQQNYNYSRLPEFDTALQQTASPRHQSCRRYRNSVRHLSGWSVKLLVILWTILSISLGYAMGILLQPQQWTHLVVSSVAHIPRMYQETGVVHQTLDTISKNSAYIHTVPTQPYIFKYNRTFAEGPSQESDQAWKSLFPARGGFFNMPSGRSTLSVFHQLHCLDGIRQNYWELYDALHAGGNTSHTREESQEHRMISPAHVRHCLDLVRQSLMCNADTTLEIKEENVNGVHGFGVLHQCSDWNHLLEVVSERQIV